VTEEQVFQPERRNLGRALNVLFLEPLGFKHVRLTVKGADFHDPVEISKVLTPFIQAGAVAPNDLRELLGQVLGRKVDPFPEEYNVPLQVVLRSLGTDDDPLSGLFSIQKSKERQTDLINLLKDIRDVLEVGQNE
jgi:capsid portal protein